MEYIMINESKLKVMMEKNDFEALDISLDELDYTNPDAKNAFESIFEYAKEELGFDTSGHRILLQLFPSKDGGCELFITKLGILSGNAFEEEESSNARKDFSKIKRAYSFDKLSSLLIVCKMLSSKLLYKESSAFVDNAGRWFLILTVNDTFDEDELKIITDITFISEYGQRENTDTLSLYLGEYGKEICGQNAIEILGKI